MKPVSSCFMSLAVLAGFLITATLAVSALWAQEEYDFIPIRPIHPPKEIRSVYMVAPEEVLKGRIERIDAGGAVIDSRYRRFSDVAAILSGSGKTIHESEFTPGMSVGFCVDEMEHIKVLWNLEPGYVSLP